MDLNIALKSILKDGVEIKKEISYLGEHVVKVTFNGKGYDVSIIEDAKYDSPEALPDDSE